MHSKVLNKLAAHLRAFRADEDGAVTVDFVVLTSSLILFGLAHVKDVADASVNLAGDVSSCLSTDIANILVDGDPDQYIANLQAAQVACSER